MSRYDDSRFHDRVTIVEVEEPHTSPPDRFRSGTQPARLVNGWIYIEPAADEAIGRLRDSLYREAPSHAYDPVDEPHVTVIPGFNIPATCVYDLTQEVESLALLDEPFVAEHLKCYPNRHDPRHVLVDADIDLSDTRVHLTEHIESAGGAVYNEPVPPHVTLLNADFNARDPWELSDDEHDQLESAIDAHTDRASLATQVEEITVAITDP